MEGTSFHHPARGSGLHTPRSREYLTLVRPIVFVGDGLTGSV